MSGSDYAFQLNVKLGVGYDAHLINIVGISQPEFEENLKWATTNAAGIVSTATALEAAYGVKELAPHVASVQVSNEAPGQWAERSYSQPAQQQQQYQQPAQQPQQGPAPSCAHGPMTLRPAGVSKNTEKAYNAFWACTGPRENQCKTVNA